MRKIEKIRMQINDSFRDHLKAAMKEKGVDVVTEYSFIAMNLVTRTVDGRNMTPEQMEFMKGFSDGYAAAMVQVTD